MQFCAVHDGQWTTCPRAHPHGCHQVPSVQGSRWELRAEQGKGKLLVVISNETELQSSESPTTKYVICKEACLPLQTASMAVSMQVTSCQSEVLQTCWDPRSCGLTSCPSPSCSTVTCNLQIYKVPATDGEALKSSLLGFFEKFRAKKFFVYVQDYEENDPKTHDGLDLRKMSSRDFFA
jgi:hypothetical protein